MPYSSKEKEEIESLMDRTGVQDFFRALAEIAYEKSDHVMEAWQDSRLARRWVRLGAKWDKTATSIDDPYFQ